MKEQPELPKAVQATLNLISRAVEVSLRMDGMHPEVAAIIASGLRRHESPEVIAERMIRWRDEIKDQ